MVSTPMDLSLHQHSPKKQVWPKNPLIIPKLPSSSQIPEVWPNKAHPALHPVSPPRVHLTPASIGETPIKLKTKNEKILMFIVQGEIADWMVENRTFFELWPLKPGKNCPPRGPLATPRKQRELWMVHSVGFYPKYSHFCPTFRDEIVESFLRFFSLTLVLLDSILLLEVYIVWENEQNNWFVPVYDNDVL